MVLLPAAGAAEGAAVAAEAAHGEGPPSLFEEVIADNSRVHPNSASLTLNQPVPPADRSKRTTTSESCSGGSGCVLHLNH